MANVKFYSDFNGATVEITAYHSCMKNAEFAVQFPGIKGVRYDGYAMWIGRAVNSFVNLPVTRMVTFKSNPSRHQCDARCTNAVGRTMQCECSCGGKNHGSGRFNCQ